MNLCIDIGNTRTKIAVFNGKEKIFFQVFEKINTNLIRQIITQFGIERLILSSVAETSNALLADIMPTLPYCIELTQHTPLPIINAYRTPHTLGKDRLAAIVGANALFPHNDLLVIDAGTCIKYDFIDQNGRYHGGGIAPGLLMRLNALHSFTQRLPLLTMPPPPISNLPLTGGDTSEAMLSGVFWGALSEMDGLIERYKAQSKNLKTLLTGGDTPFFENTLKNQVFVRPYLVLEGLNQILTHNNS